LHGFVQLDCLFAIIIAINILICNHHYDWNWSFVWASSQSNLLVVPTRWSSRLDRAVFLSSPSYGLPHPSSKIIAWLAWALLCNKLFKPSWAQLTFRGMLVDGGEGWRRPHVRTIIIVTYGPKQWKRSIDV
jgi:hypothetical protein